MLARNPGLPSLGYRLRRSLGLIPSILRLLLSRIFYLSETSKYNDLRSALTVVFLRNIMEPSVLNARPMDCVQKDSLRPVSVQGRMWISKYISTPPPEKDLINSLVKVIGQLADPDFPAPKTHFPEFIPVEAEWTGYRANATPSDPLPDISEADKYTSMVEECRSPMTILYIHGGGHYLLDPATHRPMVTKLVKVTGGKAYSVRYRLSPQGVFPDALLDCLVSYFTLLYPPPGAFHEPIKPEHIVIAGDSAGGNLAMALVQVLVELSRAGSNVMWHGQPRKVPVPAACACSSAWLDITMSSEPWHNGMPAIFDFVPQLERIGYTNIQPCDIWPAQNPRKFLYAADDMVVHPLVCPVMRRSWEGFPPMYFCAGWERLGYENRFLAKKLAADGVQVVFEEYEAMPHCFAMVLTHLPEARRCIDGWGGFMENATNNPLAMDSKALTIRARTLKEDLLQFEDLCNVSEEEVRRRLVAKVNEVPIFQPPPKL